MLSKFRRGGKPFEMTTVTDRAMKSIPSVVMKDGMLNVIDIQPLRKPTIAQIVSPKSIAGQNGQP